VDKVEKGGKVGQDESFDESFVEMGLTARRRGHK
jgi:hypothetical protein